MRARRAGLRSSASSACMSAGSGALKSSARSSSGCAKASRAACSAWRRKPAARRQRRRRAGDQPAPAAVDRIADHREADVRQVHADLVRAPGLELHAHQRVRAEALARRGSGSPRGARRRAPPCGCAACGGGRSAHRSCRRRSCTPVHSARYSRRDRARRQGRHQRGVRLGRARHDQQAAGVLVEAVDEPGARHAARASGRAPSSAFCSVCAGLPAPGCTTRPAGLFEHDERAVLVHDARAAWPRAPACSLHRQPRLDAHLLPAQHLVAWPQRAGPSTAAPARPRSRRWRRAREYCGRAARQGLIEAQPGRAPAGSCEGMGAELRGACGGRKGSRGIRYTDSIYATRCHRKALRDVSVSSGARAPCSPCAPCCCSPSRSAAATGATKRNLKRRPGGAVQEGAQGDECTTTSTRHQDLRAR